MSLPVVIYSSFNDLLALTVSQELIKSQLEVSVIDECISQDARNLFPANVSFISFSQAQATPGGYYFFIDSGTKLKNQAGTKQKNKITAQARSQHFEAYKKIAQTGHGKVVWVFPLLSFDTTDQIQSILSTQTGYQKLLLVGDVYSPLMDIDNKREISQMLAHAAKNAPLPVSMLSSELFIVDSDAATRAIMRATFSYWYHGKIETQTITKKSSYTEIVEELGTHGMSVTLAPKSSILKPRPIIKVGKVIHGPAHVFDTVTALRTMPVHAVPVKPKVAFTNVKRYKVAKVQEVRTTTHYTIRRPKVLLLFIATVWIILTPFLILGSGGVSLAIAGERIVQGDTRFVGPLLAYSEVSGKVGEGIFGALGMREFATMSSVVRQGSDLTKDGQELLLELETLRIGILGKKEYDVEASSRALALKLDSLYKKTGVLETSIDQSQTVRAFMPQSADISKIRQYVWAGKELAAELPNLISGPTQKTYMVLFQNNMELRPTGGFIGSFALITFDKGKLIDTTVMDVYTADGQLKGHVEPPAAIKNYLGEANWYLRDSNWDPDFPISATNAQWFLEKEIDREVDGVLAIDLHVVKSLLDYYGPVRLPDFNLELDSKNVYEKVQHEVESSFFPGSTKKASLLTALSESLMAKLFANTNASAAESAQIAGLFIEALEQKHMLLTFDNENAGNTVNHMNWNGSLPEGESWVSVVDANVGVNKANYFVTRNSELSVKLSRESTDYTLKVTLHNNASDPLDIKNQYKSYLRAVVPAGEFASISIANGDNVQLVQPEITKSNLKTEAGVVVSVPPTESRVVIFTWKTKPANFAQPGEFNLTMVKQPGTDQDPVRLNITTPETVGIHLVPGADLTAGSTFSYNLNLIEDFTSSISWNK